MITLEALSCALPHLTGEAVKLGVLLATSPQRELRCDLKWRTNAERCLLMSAVIIEKALRELADAQLVEIVNRVTVRAFAASMSEGQSSLAFCSSATSPSDHTSTSEATTRAEISKSASRVFERNDDEIEHEDKRASSLARQSSSEEEAAKPTKVRKRRARSAALGISGLVVPKAVDESAPPSADVRRCIDVFHTHFVEANEGSKPTWDGAQYKRMRSLVEKHGALEVEKRIVNMFTAPPRFPAPPYDLQTLCLHFDKFAKPSTLRGGMIDNWKSGEAYYAGGKP